MKCLSTFQAKITHDLKHDFNMLPLCVLMFIAAEGASSQATIATNPLSSYFPSEEKQRSIGTCTYIFLH